jgi:predicted Zn-dependent protease
LNALRESGFATASVENLLAQAYIGDQQPDPAFKAFQRAASLTPKSEKLYLLISDACADRQDYALGIRIVDAGLRELPESAHLHYQRGYFLAMLDQFDAGKSDFDFAIKQDPHAEIAFVAGAQKALFAGNLDEAISVARQAARENRANYLVLTALGEALMRSGARPGQAEFLEATDSLKAAVAARPSYASARIALGYAFLLSNSVDAAIEHLEIGRQLDPKNPAAYSHLAVAYRKVGKKEEARTALATLEQLNAEQAARIYSAPGDQKTIPGASGSAHP